MCFDHVQRLVEFPLFFVFSCLSIDILSSLSLTVLFSLLPLVSLLSLLVLLLASLSLSLFTWVSFLLVVSSLSLFLSSMCPVLSSVTLFVCLCHGPCIFSSRPCVFSLFTKMNRHTGRDEKNVCAVMKRQIHFYTASTMHCETFINDTHASVHLCCVSFNTARP